MGDYFLLLEIKNTSITHKQKWCRCISDDLYGGWGGVGVGMGSGREGAQNRARRVLKLKLLLQLESRQRRGVTCL